MLIWKRVNYISSSFGEESNNTYKRSDRMNNQRLSWYKDNHTSVLGTIKFVAPVYLFEKVKGVVHEGSFFVGSKVSGIFNITFWANIYYLTK